ncbi:MAG: hypothetical protein WC935_03480 [Thermoleophilia bacterium]
MAKKKTMIYLTERQQWQLKQHAQEKGESMAGLIRTAVDEFLARERPVLDYMAIVGMFEGEPGDNASERVDEIIGEAMMEADIHGESEETRKAVARWQAKQDKRDKKGSNKKRSA